MADTLTNRVRRGARLIDERLGRSALRRIRIRDLDVSSGGNCVLGQLLGDYVGGRGALGLGHDETERYGFRSGLVGDVDSRYERLAELWADEVRKRRGKAS